MESNIQIIYNENSNNLKLNIELDIGNIQEEVLKFFNLIIYNIEYTIIKIDNKEYILGVDDLKFENKLNEFMENNELNDIEYIKILDRKRDENGNVLKENLIIDKYNKWFQEKESSNYIQYFNNSQNNPINIENILLGQLPFTRRIIRRYNVNQNTPSNTENNSVNNDENNSQNNNQEENSNNEDNNIEDFKENEEIDDEENEEIDDEENEEIDDEEIEYEEIDNEEMNSESSHRQQVNSQTQNNQDNIHNNQTRIRNNMNNLINTFFDDTENISPINNNNFLNIINNNIQERINNINNNENNNNNLIEIDYENDEQNNNDNSNNTNQHNNNENNNDEQNMNNINNPFNFNLSNNNFNRYTSQELLDLENTLINNIQNNLQRDFTNIFANMNNTNQLNINLNNNSRNTQVNNNEEEDSNNNNQENNSNENNSLPNNININNLQQLETNFLNNMELFSNSNYLSRNLFPLSFDIIDNAQNIQNTNLNENVIIALTDEEFNEIEKINFDEIKSDSKCNICLGNFDSSSSILKLKCGHCFDYDCIKNWLKNHSNKCPVCREEVAKGHPINL